MLCVGISFPTLQRLLEELKDVDNWFVSGIPLGVPVKQLQKIESSHRGDNYREMQDRHATILARQQCDPLMEGCGTSPGTNQPASAG